MLNKLNGWQRLWVVFSILSSIVYAFYAYYAISHDNLITLHEGKCAEEFDLRWSKSHLADQKGFSSQPNTFDLFSDKEFEPCVKKEHVKFVAKTILIWMVTISVVYGIGFSVAWVRRGFRQSKK